MTRALQKQSERLQNGSSTPLRICQGPPGRDTVGKWLNWLGGLASKDGS